MSLRHLPLVSVQTAANYSIQIQPKPLHTGKMATGSSYLIIIILDKNDSKAAILL